MLGLNTGALLRMALPAAHVCMYVCVVQGCARARERGRERQEQYGRHCREIRAGGDFVCVNIGTLLRVALPSVLAAMLGYAYFDNISLFLYQNWLSAGISSLHPTDTLLTPY